ncbi:MAG TPA: hypothetical protein VK509_25555, partial [Polyangiales bacterium]|nr:hypothetical protein [Polyangiales bacterium]
FYKWQQLHIVVWVGAAVAATAQRLGRMTPKPTPGTKRSDIHIVTSGTALPSADARAVFVELMKEMQGDLACLAVVIEGGGFWASAMRSAIIGLGMMAPKALPFRALGSLDDLSAWLPGEHKRHTGVAIDSVGLRRALTEARMGAAGGQAHAAH